jgi:GNAT superfamily N-acetyltransferase
MAVVQSLGDERTLDLATLERRASAIQSLILPDALHELGQEGWACERTGVESPCRAARLTPAVDYAAVELVGLEHHHVCWLLTLLSDPTIAHYEPMAVPPDDPRATELLASFIDRLALPGGPAQAWMVLEAGHRVGTCQLRRRDQGHLVGVSLEPGVRERGLGTALFKTLAGWGLRDGEFVAGEVEDDNVLSHGAIVSAGYAPEDRYSIVLDDGRQAVVTRYQV